MRGSATGIQAAEEESGRVHLIEVPDEVPVGTKVW